VPGIIYILLKAYILIHDSSLPDFSNVQNGYLVKNLEWKYIDPLFVLLSSSQMILYLGFTFQQYYNYRKRIQDVFANTYKIELNWIASFLYIYSFLFIYNTIQVVIDFAIVDLHWTQEWWYYFFSSIAIIFIGIKGYFTDTSKLHLLSFDTKEKNKNSNKPIIKSEIDSKKSMIEDFINKNESFLNDNINLIQLADELNMSRAELSEVINNGFGKNFNDFINSYRIEAIKRMLQDGKHQHLSLLGIAYECGFNSKATFNRVFKKLTNTSPSEYLKSL
jgi:AraC-like DNA-binding protein